MGWKLSNPVKSFSNVAKAIVKKPLSGDAWKDAAIASASGGWVASDSADVAAEEKKAKDLKNRNAKNMANGLASGYDEAKGWYGGLGREEVGAKVAEVGNMLQDRMSGKDPASAAIMDTGAGVVANAQRNLSQSGVKGGTAQNAIATLDRQRASDVASSLYRNQGLALTDQRDFLGNIIEGSRGMAYGQAALGQERPGIPKRQSWTDDLTSMA